MREACAELPRAGVSRGAHSPKSGICYGRAAKTRSAQWAGSVRHIMSRTEWCRAPRLRRRCGTSTRLQNVTGWRSAISFTPATAICTRLFYSMPASQVN